jgi:hypothetical protein
MIEKDTLSPAAALLERNAFAFRPEPEAAPLRGWQAPRRCAYYPVCGAGAMVGLQSLAVVQPTAMALWL